MKLRVLLCVALLGLLTTPASAQDDAKALIERAIAAHGGADKLNKFVAGRVQSKGSIAAQAGQVPFTSVVVYQLPDKVKNTIEFTAPGGGSRPVTQIMNGDKVGVVINGLPQEVLPAQVDEMKQGVYASNLRHLTPLLKGDKYKLAAAGEKQIAGKTAVGVKVTAPGAREVRLFFDKATDLLLAQERPSFDAAGKPVEQQEIFSDYREAEGMKYPGSTVIMQNGQRYIVSEVVSFKPLQKVESREFTIPQ
jgi:hypothetical protein